LQPIDFASVLRTARRCGRAGSAGLGPLHAAGLPGGRPRPYRGDKKPIKYLKLLTTFLATIVQHLTNIYDQGDSNDLDLVYVFLSTCRLGYRL
jgi:hypothetical protein